MVRFTVLCAGFMWLLTSVVGGAEPRGLIYKFGATWCGPCRQVAPLVERMEQSGFPIRSVDIDQDKALTERFGVQSIPTFVLVIDGKEVDRHTGVLTEADLRRMAARIPAPNPTPNPVAIPASTPRTPAGSIATPEPGSNLQIQLGEPAPLRTLPLGPRSQPEETRVVMNTEEKKGLRDLWPFGKKEAAADTAAATTVRGNNEAEAPQGAGGPTRGANTDPMESSVRIRVITQQRVDLGSGTVISSKPGHTQILTCAHIFKKFTPDSKIEVDLFENGRSSPYVAKLIQFDAESDLGLISVPTSGVVPTVSVGPASSSPRMGEPLVSIGCSGGDDPTRQQSQVAAVDRYDGPHNLQCSGLPVQGRSGGGLFNRSGEIVGVCSAADPERKEGFYSGLLAIHAFLDKCGLKELFAPQMEAAPAPAVLAAAPEAPAPVAAPAVASASAPAMPPRATMDIEAGDAEAVVIIRSKSNPHEQNRVVIFHDVSPKFYSYLTSELPKDNSGALFSQTAGSPEALPEVPRSLRSSTSIAEARQPAIAKEQLSLTTLSQPAPIQKYIRSSASREQSVR